MVVGRRWWHVELERREIWIEQALTIAGGKLVIGPTKTGKERTVTVAGAVVAALRARGRPGLIPPGSTIEYQRAVTAKLGSAATQDHVRLFVAPGVAHCWAGEGPYQIDALSALERWVEEGQAPERITATRPLAGGATRSRPLCPLPADRPLPGNRQHRRSVHLRVRRSVGARRRSVVKDSDT